MNEKNKSIIYVNFSPYENTGNILDFILKNFENVFSFSFDFHKLQKKEGLNKLRIYKDGKQIYEYSLFQLPIPQSLVFWLLPLRSFLILVQMISFCLWLRIKHGKTIDLYFTPNAFTAWIGNILKIFGVVNKTVFWVWDYYPPYHPDLIIRTMRRIYWYFDKVSTKSSRTIFLNKRLQELRKAAGLMDPKTNYPIVPIGTNPSFSAKPGNKKEVKLGFIGVLKKSQGLDLLLENAGLLIKSLPGLSIDVIGSGPDESYFKELAAKCKLKIKFHGLISEDTKEGQQQMAAILSRCTIGIAPYVPEESNVSYYGDPSKVKKYLSLGLPVVTTNVFEFSPILEESGAGVIFDYANPQSFIDAIIKISKNLGSYEKNAQKLSKRYYYENIYPTMFKD